MKLIACLIVLAAALAGVLSIIGNSKTWPTRATDTSFTHHRTVLNTPIKGHHWIIIYGLPKDARNNYACTVARSGALHCTLNTVPIFPN